MDSSQARHGPKARNMSDPLPRSLKASTKTQRHGAAIIRYRGDSYNAPSWPARRRASTMAEPRHSQEGLRGYNNNAVQNSPAATHIPSLWTLCYPGRHPFHRERLRVNDERVPKTSGETRRNPALAKTPASVGTPTPVPGGHPDDDIPNLSRNSGGSHLCIVASKLSKVSGWSSSWYRRSLLGSAPPGC